MNKKILMFVMLGIVLVIGIGGFIYLNNGEINVFNNQSTTQDSAMYKSLGITPEEQTDLRNINTEITIEGITKEYISNEKRIIITEGENTLLDLELESDYEVATIAKDDALIAWFDLKDFIGDSIVDNIRFYNVNDGYKELNKDYNFKYKNESDDWNRFTSLKELPNKQIKIGLFTNIKQGDKIEWVIEKSDFTILEWAVVIGTNAGFTNIRPVADPSGTSSQMGGWVIGINSTSPSSGANLTEIGWYVESKAWTGRNWEAGLYYDDGGTMGDLRNVSRTNALGADVEDVWVYTTVDWEIEPDTMYWISIQIDGTGDGDEPKIDRDLSGGNGEVIVGDTLPANMDGSSNNNYGWAIYAIAATPLSINITAPLNTTITTQPTTLDWTVGGDLEETCLYTDDSGDTNTTVTCGDLSTAVSFPQGSSTYFMWANDSSDTWVSSNVSFFIDSIEPATNITYPLDASTNITTYVTYDQAYIKINWSATDTNLQTCVLWNGTGNSTVTCGNNGVFANNTFGNYDFVLWANDSYGNSNSSSVNADYNYSIFYRSEDYNSVSTTGATETLRLNVSINPSQQLTTAYLIYNNTNYGAGTIVNVAGNNYTVTKSITTPSITSSSNMTFYWNLTLDNGVNSTTHLLNNQTVNPLTLDDCSTGTYVLYNFTIKDEELRTNLDNTTYNTFGDLNFQLFDLNRDIIMNYSNSYVTNSFSICLNAELSGTTEYLYDMQVQYGGDGYSTEFYHAQNETLNSTQLYNNISLYDLNLTDAQSFKLIFRDSAFLPVENALIEISRKYVDEGIYRIIEIPKTDVRGEAVASLVLNNVIYKFEVYKFGALLLSYDDVKAVCQTPAITTCTIDLNSFADTIEVIDFATKGDFNFTLGYSEATRTVTSNYLIPSNTVSTVELVVVRADALGTAGCSDSLVSASGLLSCEVPASFGNGSVVARIYVNDNQKAMGMLKLGDKREDIYGGGVVVLSLFIFLTLLGAGLGDNPISTIVFLMIGVILLMALNLIDYTGFVGKGATVLFLFIAIILIIIKGARRN